MGRIVTEIQDLFGTLDNKAETGVLQIGTSSDPVDDVVASNRIEIPTYSSDGDAPDNALFLNTTGNEFKYKDNSGNVRGAQSAIGGTVTESEIAGSAVTSPKINGGAVTAGKIGSNAVTSGKINTGAVTSSEIGSSAVQQSNIDSNAITSNKINSAAVTEPKLDDAAITNAIVDEKALADDGNLYDTVDSAVNNASSYVFVPPSTFNESVTADVAGLMIEGVGRDSHINGGSSDAITCDEADVVIKNLSVETTAQGGNSVDGITTDTNADSIVIKNVWVRDSDQHGVNLSNGTDHLVAGVVGEGADNDLLNIGVQTTVRDCRFPGTIGGDDINVSGGSDTVLVGNQIPGTFSDSGTGTIRAGNRGINTDVEDLFLGYPTWLLSTTAGGGTVNLPGADATTHVIELRQPGNSSSTTEARAYDPTTEHDPAKGRLKVDIGNITIDDQGDARIFVAMMSSPDSDGLGSGDGIAGRVDGNGRVSAATQDDGTQSTTTDTSQNNSFASGVESIELFWDGSTLTVDVTDGSTTVSVSDSTNFPSGSNLQLKIGASDVAGLNARNVDFDIGGIEVGA